MWRNLLTFHVFCIYKKLFKKKSITSERLSIRHEIQCNVKSGVFYCLTNIIVTIYIYYIYNIYILYIYIIIIYNIIYILYLYIYIYIRSDRTQSAQKLYPNHPTLEASTCEFYVLLFTYHCVLVDASFPLRHSKHWRVQLNQFKGYSLPKLEKYNIFLPYYKFNTW